MAVTTGIQLASTLSSAIPETRTPTRADTVASPDAVAPAGGLPFAKTLAGPLAMASPLGVAPANPFTAATAIFKAIAAPLPAPQPIGSKQVRDQILEVTHVTP